MPQPLVSVIIPMYNSEKYVSDPLNSVFTQSYTNWECIIVDDGSTDSSKKIAKEFCKKDKRFRYYYQSNSGQSAARNHGLKLSSGDYIQYLDADDVLLPNYLETMTEQSEHLEDNVILYSDFFLGNSNNIFDTKLMNRPASIGKDITFNEMYRMFALDFLLIPSCFLFPRKAIWNIKWSENLNHAEDWDYYLSLLRNNYMFRCYSIPLVIYRNTPSSLSKNSLKIIEANYFILSKWLDNNNLLTFSRRCALVFVKTIFLYLGKKTDKIIVPKFNSNKFSFQQYLFILLIYPLTIFYFFSEIIRILINRIKSINNEI